MLIAHQVMSKAGACLATAKELLADALCVVILFVCLSACVSVFGLCNICMLRTAGLVYKLSDVFASPILQVTLANSAYNFYNYFCIG